MAEHTDMAGQWFGRSRPSEGKESIVVINIEPRAQTNAQVLGVRLRADDEPQTLGFAHFQLDGKQLKGRSENFHVYDPNPQVDDFIPLEAYFKRTGIKGEVPRETDFSGEYDGVKWAGTFRSNLNQSGEFELWRTFYEASFRKAREPVTAPQAITWSEFKLRVSSLKNRGQILFRGQNSTHPLRTLFHRMRRNNLFRYLREDVGQLRHHINALSPYCYRNFGEDITGLLSLAQHHGFPTPLLDWTLSPYIAAFFAFDCHKLDQIGWKIEKDKDPTPARVFTFDWEKWRNADRQLAQSLKDPWPDFQFFHPSAHNNPRYYPQQSVAAFSNIDNIEDFVAAVETSHSTQYLSKTDIRADQRGEVEDELRFMGITSATLFPGFEGACRALRAELF